MTKAMLDPARCAHRFVASLAVTVLASAACKAPVDQVVAPRGSGAGGRDMVTTLLDQAATMSIEEYDAVRVVHAVNALQALGKDVALQRIDTCLDGFASPTDAQGLFWILRVLFDMPPGQRFPPVRIGLPNIPPPADPAKLPRYPIMIVQDVPFLVVSGYDLGGLPESVATHIAYFREHGVLRNRRLTLPASIKGLEQEILRQWKAEYGDDHADEALRAMRSQIAKLDR